MRHLLLAALLWVAAISNGYAQAAYSAPDAVDVRLTIEVARDKNGRSMNQPGAMPWDLGVYPIALPDIAFCVIVPGKMNRWCSPGYSPGGPAKALCQDKLSCTTSVRLPRDEYFEIAIIDVDLQFHDPIGHARCRMTTSKCTVGAAEVTVWVTTPSDFCSTAEVNYNLNIQVAADWRRTVNRHNELVDEWARVGARRLEELEEELAQAVLGLSGDRIREVTRDMAFRDAKALFLEIRQALVDASGKRPLTAETKQRLRDLLESTLQRGARVGRFVALPIIIRRMNFVAVVLELLPVFQKGYRVLEAWVATSNNRAITQELGNWQRDIAQRASSLAEEARRRGCPVSPILIERYQRVVAGR